MARTWEQLRAKSKLTPEQHAAVDAEVQAEIAKMRLGELRKARQLSQAQIADQLGMAQGDVSKLERRTDIYVRTMIRYVEALGGRLRIVAEFPNGEPFEIEGFGDLEPPEATSCEVVAAKGG